MSRMRFSWSTTTMLSRRFCTMYCDSCARLARSTCCRRTVASVSRRRRAIGQASSATRKTMPPRMPVAGIVGGVGGPGDVRRQSAARTAPAWRARPAGTRHGCRPAGPWRRPARRTGCRAAGDAAAREQQQADGDRVDHGVHERGRTQIGQQAAAADDDGDARGEIHHAGPEEQLRMIAADRSAFDDRRSTNSA